MGSDMLYVVESARLLDLVVFPKGYGIALLIERWRVEQERWLRESGAGEEGFCWPAVDFDED